MIKSLYDVYYNDNIIDTEAKEFIQTWHYSKSARSLQPTHVFKLVDKSNKLVGIAIYGRPMCRHYKGDTVELRRLCLIDDTPRNTESFFIGKTLRWLAKNTEYKQVVSFADPNHGHLGTIYRASNFKYEGLEDNGNPRVVKEGNKNHHLREYYAKKDGQYTSSALRLQEAVRNGSAEIIKQERKHRYTFNLDH